MLALVKSPTWQDNRWKLELAEGKLLWLQFEALASDADAAKVEYDRLKDHCRALKLELRARQEQVGISLTLATK